MCRTTIKILEPVVNGTYAQSREKTTLRRTCLKFDQGIPSCFKRFQSLASLAASRMVDFLHIITSALVVILLHNCTCRFSSNETSKINP